VKQFTTIPGVCRAVISSAARTRQSVRNLACRYSLGRNTIYVGVKNDLPRRHSIAAMLLLQRDMTIPVEDRGVTFDECNESFVCLLRDDYYADIQFAREEIFALLNISDDQRVAVLKQLN